MESHLRPRATAWMRRVVASTLNGLQAGRFFATCLALVLIAAPVAQAQSSTGSVEGRVLNTGNGRYVGNVRVTVEGTALEALTNEFGEYRLSGVPAGEAQVRAAVSGLDSKVMTVSVTAGQPTKVDFELTSAERYGTATDGDTVKLDTFVVSANREFEGNAIATNEQRFAKGLKVVMAADAFGDVTEGNAGEFLKYLPGITVDYVAADVRTVSVRGFAANFTNVYLDGMPTTSSASGSSARVFEFEQVSINNAARVEVLKVPTPDTPANGLGGNVNLVSKSSFERKGAQFNYRAYLSMNHEALSLGRTPGPDSGKSFKILPGFDFDYTLPVNDRFGIVITGLSSNQFNEQHRWQTSWNHAQGGATLANPMLQTAQIQDGPKNTFRESASIKADWKITDNQRLSVMVQDSYYKSFFGNRNLNFNIGTTATTAAVGGTVLQWSPGFSQSATGTFSSSDPYGNRGRVTQGSSFRDKLGNTFAANARWTYTGSLWNAEAGIHMAKSRTWYRALARDHFANVGTRMVGVANLRVNDIAFPYHTFTATNATGGVINPYDLGNYRVTTLSDDPIDGVAEMRGAYADVKRDFDIAGMPVSVKIGARVYEESKDNRRATKSYTFVGADGLANTADDSAAPFLDTVYSGEDPYWGSQPIQWINAYKLAETFKSNPNYFTTNAVTNEIFRLNNSEKITETITAGYVQLEGKLLNNRLQWIAGARYERTKDAGEGVLRVGNDVLFEKNADGSLRDGDPLTAGVQYVRTAAAGPAGTSGSSNSALTATQVPSGTLRTTAPYTFTNMTLQELALTSFERGSTPVRSYDDIYPSLNLTYNVTDNLLVRFGFAVTMGRPDYAQILPNTTIDDNENFDFDPTASPGTLTTRNTGLKPWEANNYDVSVEYYYGKGGVLSGGVFQKDITNFFQSRTGTVDAALAEELGIGQEFIGWGVSTTVNGPGTATIKGIEINSIRQLDFIPGWGRYFSVSANATKLQLEGPSQSAFSGFIPKTGNIGLSFNKKPVSAKINLNYRGRQQRNAQTGAQYGGAVNGFYEYYQSRVNVDVNVEYTFSKRFKVFANARNIFNVPQVLERVSTVNETPIHAQRYQQEEFGIQMAIGVKGSF